MTGVQTCALPILDSKKAGVLPQRKMGSIKSGGAAAARIGKYKKREIGRASCRERV